MNIQSAKLSNGLTTLLIDTGSFPTITMMVLVGAGSRYENKKNNGIAHFFEHMAFKGSQKYPSSYDISSTIEGFGGQFNAFTSKDHTGYWVKAPNEYFETVSSVLSDMILHPLLVPEEIEREKGVIVEEINMHQDVPAQKVSDVFDELIFEGHPLGYDIAGTPKTVRSFTKKTFTDYLSSYYHPSNTTIVVAGGLNMGSSTMSSSDSPVSFPDSPVSSPDSPVSSRAQPRDPFSSQKEISPLRSTPVEMTRNYLYIIEKHFGDWTDQKKPEASRFLSDQSSPQISVKTNSGEQAHICVGYRAFAFTDPRRYPLSALSTILGGGMSSRLFLEVRERRGLCYYISTGRDLYDDTGYLVTQAGVSPDKKKVNEAIKVIIGEHMRIADGHISDTDIDRAKALLKGRLLLSLEDSHAVAALYGTRKLLYGDMPEIAEILSSIDEVSKEQIVSVAKDLFVENGMNIAAVGPIEEGDIQI